MLAFIVWIISKGELPTYLAFFTVGNNTASASESGKPVAPQSFSPFGAAPSGTQGATGGSVDPELLPGGTPSNPFGNSTGYWPGDPSSSNPLLRMPGPPYSSGSNSGGGSNPLLGGIP
jgi:hypothetical protein